MRASNSTADPAGAHICCVCSVQLSGSVGQLCFLCEEGINSVPPFSSLKASMQTLNCTPSTAASVHLVAANLGSYGSAASADSDRDLSQVSSCKCALTVAVPHRAHRFSLRIAAGGEQCAYDWLVTEVDVGSVHVLLQQPEGHRVRYSGAQLV